MLSMSQKYPTSYYQQVSISNERGRCFHKSALNLAQNKALGNTGGLGGLLCFAGAFEALQLPTSECGRQLKRCNELQDTLSSAVCVVPFPELNTACKGILKIKYNRVSAIHFLSPRVVAITFRLLRAVGFFRDPGNLIRKNQNKIIQCEWNVTPWITFIFILFYISIYRLALKYTLLRSNIGI